MPDPASNRLQACRDQVDATFGAGDANQHSDLVAAVLIATSLDLAAFTIAAALAEDAEPLVPMRRSILR
jgi:hypothetical protein